MSPPPGSRRSIPRFSELTLTLIYSAYAVGNIVALLLLGRLSDQIGRRRVALPAVGLAAVTSASPSQQGLRSARWAMPTPGDRWLQLITLHDLAASWTSRRPAPPSPTTFMVNGPTHVAPRPAPQPVSAATRRPDASGIRWQFAFGAFHAPPSSMATPLSHAVVPLALGAGLGERTLSRRLVAAGMIASVAPDLDVVGLRLGIPYGATVGHRGATHSLAFALAVAALGAVLHRPLGSRARCAFAFLLAATASHALLDALTNGGLGVAILWPLSDARWFAPVRPIQVAPLGLGGLRGHALALLVSEGIWVWAPSLALAAALAWRRRRRGGWPSR